MDEKTLDHLILSFTKHIEKVENEKSTFKSWSHRAIKCAILGFILSSVSHNKTKTKI